jgi:general secretion pathway protein B
MQAQPASPTPAPAMPPAAQAAAQPAATSVAPPVAPAAPPAADNRILSIGELPPDLRRELPTFVVSGSVYSELPSARFVMLNGQLMHEGDKLGNDLVLEQIQLRFAVLRYKGMRFRITY